MSPCSSARVSHSIGNLCLPARCFVPRTESASTCLLNEVSELVDAGILRTTFGEHFGRIEAANLRRAHALIESGTAKGKIVLEGFLRGLGLREGWSRSLDFCAAFLLTGPLCCLVTRLRCWRLQAAVPVAWPE